MRLNICSASHFIHASAYGYVSLTIKEDSLKVWYDYVVGKFWQIQKKGRKAILNLIAIAVFENLSASQFSKVHFCRW